MLGVDFSRESTGTPRANLWSGVFTSTWFTQLWYRVPSTKVHLRHELSNEHLFFEKPACVQMLDCLKSPFVIHAALFLENTSNNKNVIRDYG